MLLEENHNNSPSTIHISNAEIMKSSVISDVKELVLSEDNCSIADDVSESTRVDLNVNDSEESDDEDLNNETEVTSQSTKVGMVVQDDGDETTPSVYYTKNTQSPSSLSLPNRPRTDSLSEVASISSASPGTIDWESLTNIEMRMITDNEALQLVYARRDFLLVQDEYMSDKDNNDSKSLDGFNNLSLTPNEIGDILLRSFESGDDLSVNSSSYSSPHYPWKDIPSLTISDPSSYDNNELLLWSAIISDYRKASVKVPKYASMMVYSGIPPALRGRAWKAMANAHSPTLLSLYDSLAAESTHFSKIIGRDLNRTFPEIGLFREKGGAGQAMLGRVMRAYSAYDIQVGYCQGLTFLVGPLLLHMNDRDAFCVMVRLMEDYELRSMFTVDMAGVQMRMYQFDYLLADILPELHQHFNELEMTTIYASQWFLSMFAVTCPLNMLVRIYDLIFCEGAISTLMRTSLAVLKRNQSQLLEFDDEEPILELLLGKSLWEVYHNDADLLISDITSIDGCAIISGLEISEEAYLSMGKLERARSRRNRGKKFVSGSEGNSTTPSARTISTVKNLSTIPPRFLSGLPWSNAWASIPAHRVPKSTSSTATLKRSTSHQSLSSASTLSSDKEDSFCDDCETRSNSVSSLNIPDIKVSGESPSNYTTTSLQLQQLNSSLEVERKERQVDKEILQSLLAEIPVDVIKSNPKLVSLSSQLCQRLQISDDAFTDAETSASCSSCDRLLMDLAAAKSKEVLAYQQLDLLQDELDSFKSQFAPLGVPQKTVRPSPSKWNLW